MRFIFALFALASFSALAHPGHSPFEGSPAHLATSPFHLVILAATAASLFLGACFIRHMVARRALQYIALGLAVLTLAVS